MEFPKESRDGFRKYDEILEYERWKKTKIKALVRDFQREKLELRSNIVLKVEEEISDNITKIQNELEYMKTVIVNMLNIC